MRRPVRYISLFSGMEAATAAFEKLGIPAEPVAFAEIDPVASAVLAHKWPHVPNAGDVAAFDWSVYRGQVDIVFGGSPCQSFSVAGKRLGLEDPRGNLALEYLRVVRATDAELFVYENVPGLLSSAGGADFRAFLAAVDECGYTLSWRILDAQHFGVPQRRRRVWAVGRAGDDWASPLRVLFEPESEGWDSPTRRKTRKGAAATAGEGARGVGYAAGFKPSAGATMVDISYSESVIPCLTTAANNIPGVVYSEPEEPLACDMRNGTLDAVAPTLQKGGQGVSLNSVPSLVYRQQNFGEFSRDGTTGTLCAHAYKGGNLDLVVSAPPKPSRLVVRRLTPLECLRLQGFPDDWLDGVLHKGKPLSDSAKYKLAGNSWAVPCAAWVIGRLVDRMGRLGLLDEEADEMEKLAAD